MKLRRANSVKVEVRSTHADPKPPATPAPRILRRHHTRPKSFTPSAPSSSIAPAPPHPPHTDPHHVGRPCRSSVFPSGSSSIPARCHTLLRRSRGKACRCQRQASYRAVRRRWHLCQRSGTGSIHSKTEDKSNIMDHSTPQPPSPNPSTPSPRP